MMQHLQNVDVFLMPTLPFTAPRKGQGQEQVRIGDRDDSVLTGNMRFNALASLSALPGISLPAGFDADGLPVGMQLVGRDGSESQLLALGRAFQQQHDFHQRMPDRLRA